jgi:hypothetical protein
MDKRIAASVARRWLRKTASMGTHGIAVYQGKIDPQTDQPFATLLNSAIPRDIGSTWLLEPDAVMKVKRGTPFLVQYHNDGDTLDIVPLTKLN